MENKKWYWWPNIVIGIGILLILFQTLISGRGDFIDFVFQALGGLAITWLTVIVLGFIPYLILKKRIQRAKFITFSICFLLISILTLIGNLYRGI